jgi:hypothetical protein
MLLPCFEGFEVSAGARPTDSSRMTDAVIGLRGQRAARAVTRLKTDALFRTVVVVYVGALLVTLPVMLVQDTWLTLVSGREIVQHGLPSHDHLTVWSSGVRWIDQQWLAQLAFYGLFRLGGVKLLLFTHLALLVAAFVLALRVARRLGASERSLCITAGLCVPAAPWILQVRAQTLATVLFVTVLGLLVLDGRHPSRRVLIVLPLLAVWGNMHGTALLAALLACARGVTILLSRERATEPAWKLRAAALILAPLTLFCSPYGFSVVQYYRSIVANRAFSKFIQEWQPSTPAAKTGFFFVLALVTVWFAGRNTKRLTLFEHLVLAVTLLSALTAIRSIVWFVLTALMLLPVLLEPASAKRLFRPERRPLTPHVFVAVAVAGLALFSLLRPPSWFMQYWPQRSLPALRQAAQDPSVRVFASDRYADWLLWEVPQLRGRVAYDIRFELMRTKQLKQLVTYRNEIGDHWRRTAAGYKVFAFDLRHDRKGWVDTTKKGRGARVLYRDNLLGVAELR